MGYGKYKNTGSWSYLELKLQTAGIHVTPEIFEQLVQRSLMGTGLLEKERAFLERPHLKKRRGEALSSNEALALMKNK